MLARTPFSRKPSDAIEACSSCASKAGAAVAALRGNVLRPVSADRNLDGRCRFVGTGLPWRLRPATPRPAAACIPHVVAAVGHRHVLRGVVGAGGRNGRLARLEIPAGARRRLTHRYAHRVFAFRAGAGIAGAARVRFLVRVVRFRSAHMARSRVRDARGAPLAWLWKVGWYRGRSFMVCYTPAR